LARLELIAPADHPGAVVTHATLRKGSAVVGEFAGLIAVSGGSGSASVLVTEPPDNLDVEFRVPFGGILTTYSILVTEFVPGAVYYLPEPSLGGTIPPQPPGDPNADARFLLSVIEPSEDTQSPSCEIRSPDPGQLGVTVQDQDSGLASISVRLARNIDIQVPDFDPGTTDPVVFAGTIDDPNRSVTLLLKVRDEAGNLAICKHFERRRRLVRERPFRYRFPPR
jgi:hypothetical protein